MDKYRHTVSSSLDTTVSPPNQIRVSSRKRFLSLYVKQACNLLNTAVDSTSVVSNIREAQLKSESGSPKVATQNGDDIMQDGKAVSSPSVVGYFKSVSFFGVGRAMTNAITAAEMVKMKMPELHQTCHVSTMEVKDIYEPLEEGLDVMEQTRNAATLTITLTTDGSTMDDTHVGYQKPGEAITFESEPGKRYKGPNRVRRRQGVPKKGQGSQQQGRVPEQRNAERTPTNETTAVKSPTTHARRRARNPDGVGKSGGGRQLNTVSNSTSASGPVSPNAVLSPASSPSRRRRTAKKPKDDGTLTIPGAESKRWMASQKTAITGTSTLLTARPTAVAAQ
eukprot:GHVS01041100.1.p1 GENE.GHVS01041100.1~~GHVS01041100.1.p1  ORF type:complete len:336 (+),score=39.83 GHVS01041100.1:64-1071(+)